MDTNTASTALTPIHLPVSVTSLLFSAVPIVALLYGFWDEYADYLQSQTLQNYQGHLEEFDFIIVGGGSAGSVLANRLTKTGNYSVLLLEAGGNPNPMQKVPIYFTVMFHTPQVSSDYYTVPQSNACLALKNQRSYWPRGNGLGGSSSLNCMFFQRGNKNDYDKWAELSGDDAWKFDSILRNFKNIEDYHGVFSNDKWHSHAGVYVSASSQKQLLPEFLEAGREMGYMTEDVNGFQEAAFSPMDLTIKNGHRNDAYSAFLKPILDRKNLKIYRYARVTKVQFNKNRKAVGVIYTRHGVEHSVKAKLEVILSSGALETPKLLMLSGIGPQRHLRKIGIKPILDLPIGQNLQDHTMVMLGPFITNATNQTYNIPRDFTIETITNYIKDGTGVMSTPLLTNGVGYVYSSIALKKMKVLNLKSNKISPDIQLVFAPINPPLYSTLEKAFSFKEGYLRSYWQGIDKEDSFLIIVMLAKPKSRGEMRLASANPLDKPILNPKYFSHPDDIQIIADGLNFTVTMVETTKVFQKLGAHLIDRHLPGCEQFVLKSMEYYECFARHVTLTVYHPSGTCSMGKRENDPKAVVDSKLRVLNTKNLRVADASLIPEIPNSNLNAAVYMIADKASEIILNFWNTNSKLE